jgi:ribosomal-protein-alanine N-acetyltransferase
MKEGDIAMVRAIEDISYPNPWSESTFRGEIQNPSISFPLVVLHRPENKVVGYIIYWHIKDDVQVNNIAVHPEFRGKGIGTALMKHVMEKVRRAGVTFVNLEVRTSNTSAQSLYTKLGFEVLGVRKGYYMNPKEDAIIMGLFLGQ